MRNGISTSYGPATTLGRNFALIAAAVLGLVCLIAPALQGASVASAVYFAVIGLVLIGTLVITAFRWKPLVGRAKREAHAVGASSGFAFMQAQFGARNDSRYTGPGWVIISDHQLTICFQPSLLGGGGSIERREILFTEILDVRRRDITSMAYASLVLSFSGSDEEIALTLAPGNGSGLRGPRDAEIDAAIADIRMHM